MSLRSERHHRVTAGPNGSAVEVLWSMEALVLWRYDRVPGFSQNSTVGWQRSTRMESAAGMEADDVAVKVAHDCEPIKPSARVRTIAITLSLHPSEHQRPAVAAERSNTVARYWLGGS